MPAEAPPRPASVPESAFWTGGLDGGVFVVLSHVAGNSYSGTIYDDAVGDPIYSGRFSYSGDDEVDVSNPANFGAWDGDLLFLRNGETMRAMSVEGN